MVQVWSADGKQIEAFTGVSDDIATAVYVPFTHSYWQVSRNGNVNAYDARAPAKITDYVHQSNGLIGQDVERLLVPPHSDCMFATTTDKGLIMYRCSISVLVLQHALLMLCLDMCMPTHKSTELIA